MSACADPAQLGRVVDVTKVELYLHQLVCGRHRKNIKLIESSTGTAIYFPPLFSQVYRYCPPNANRRDPADIFITGDSPQAIELAKQKLHETVSRIRLFVKDVNITPIKIDCILLTRLDKLRKILEANGTHIMFPPLASQRTTVRVQGSEGLPVERTVRELMSLVGSGCSARDEAVANAPSGRPVLWCGMVYAACRSASLPRSRRHQDDAGRHLRKLGCRVVL